MSFSTKQAKQKHDNDYLNYLMLQIKNTDKIVQHNANSDLSFQDGQPVDPEAEPTDVRPLEDQLLDDVKQRRQAYKNASKLFDKDTTRIDKLMSYLAENEYYAFFNQVYPQIYSELHKKNAFIVDTQVIAMLEKIIEDENLLDINPVAEAVNDTGDYMRNGLFGDQGMNVNGGPADMGDMYGNDAGNYLQYLAGDMADYANEDSNGNWYDFMFGQSGEGLNGSKKSKPMTAKEKKLQLKLNTLLKKPKK